MYLEIYNDIYFNPFFFSVKFRENKASVIKNFSMGLSIKQRKKMEQFDQLMKGLEVVGKSSSMIFLKDSLKDFYSRMVKEMNELLLATVILLQSLLQVQYYSTCFIYIDS